MISLIKKFFKIRKVIKIRNHLNFKPVDMIINKKKNYISVSDSFLWRTDYGFVTKFKFLDILDMFYDAKHTFVEIFIYTKNGDLIKSLIVENLKKTNELTIDKNFLGGLEDYGYFNIFHHDLTQNSEFIISNRCYLGFSKDNNFFSYVHGNLLSKFKDNLHSELKSDIIQNSLSTNQEYSIQNNFKEFPQTEFYFANPTSDLIKFEILGEKYLLKKNNCKIIKFDKIEKKVIIKSNCMFLRPIIFNYKQSFFDVYHG